MGHLSSFYDSLNSSPGILTESDFCQPKESDLSLACHFQNRSPALNSAHLEQQLVTVAGDYEHGLAGAKGV